MSNKNDSCKILRLDQLPSGWTLSSVATIRNNFVPRRWSCGSTSSTATPVGTASGTFRTLRDTRYEVLAAALRRLAVGRGDSDDVSERSHLQNQANLELLVPEYERSKSRKSLFLSTTKRHTLKCYDFRKPFFFIKQVEY